jgi:hypothetical protein
MDQKYIEELVLYAWKKLEISVTMIVAIPKSIPVNKKASDMEPLF